MENTELIDAVRSGDRAAVATLIQVKGGINGTGEQGWTALSFAAGKGDLELVRLLVEKGADVFHVGRDQRTPYKIALAAAHADVARFLRKCEEESEGGDPAPDPGRKYCRAYALGDLRRFPAWTEGLTTGNRRSEGEDAQDLSRLSDETIVFLHHDFTVCESIWPGEKVIFRSEDPSWQEFCTNVLAFKVPGDLDLIAEKSS